MRIRFHRAGPETQQAEGRARWLRPESSRGDLRRTGAAGACAGKPIDKGGRTNVRQPLSVALLAALAACKSKEPPPTSAEPTPPSPAAAADAAARPPTSPPPTATSGDVLDLPFKEAKAALVEGFERDYLTALLARHRGNISRAASEAGIDRNYVHRLVKKYGLEVDRG